MKYLFLVYHSPDCSEYGNLFNVIAENDSECLDVILNNPESDYTILIDEESLEQDVVNAKRFALSENLNSQLVNHLST